MSHTPLKHTHFPSPNPSLRLPFPCLFYASISSFTSLPPTTPSSAKWRCQRNLSLVLLALGQTGSKSESIKMSWVLAWGFIMKGCTLDRELVTECMSRFMASMFDVVLRRGDSPRFFLIIHCMVRISVGWTAFYSWGCHSPLLIQWGGLLSYSADIAFIHLALHCLSFIN